MRRVAYGPAKWGTSLLVALRDWVASGKEPPASAYPTIARKTLVPIAEVKFPFVPASEFSTRGVAARRMHLDRGPDFREADIAGVMAEPPRVGTAYPLLVPQVDADGNRERHRRLGEWIPGKLRHARECR
jgi:hypothetical protein